MEESGPADLILTGDWVAITAAHHTELSLTPYTEPLLPAAAVGDARTHMYHSWPHRGSFTHQSAG